MHITIISAMVSILLIYLCYTDIRYRLLPNKVVLLIFALSCLLGWFSKENSDKFTLNIILFLAVLSIGFFLSYFNIIGAGDAKLLASLSISLTTTAFCTFSFLFALLGLPVAIITLIIHRISKSEKSLWVPYGVAIAAGYWIVVLV